MSKRLFDRLDHDHYGPIRRCWVMLVGLYGTNLEVVDRYYQYEYGVPWDHDLYDHLDADMPAMLALRTVIQRILDITPD